MLKTCSSFVYSGTCLRRPPLGPGSTDVNRSFRTTGSGYNGKVVALYRWPLEQVPLYHMWLPFTLLDELSMDKTEQQWVRFKIKRVH